MSVNATSDSAPAVPSPLNPEISRPGRSKKESLKKKEARGEPVVVQHDGDQAIRMSFGNMKADDFELGPGATFVPHHLINHPDGGEVQFYDLKDNARNKKGYRYLACVADATFPHIAHYRQSENQPEQPRFDFADMASQMYMDRSGRHITGDAGWRSAKTNVFIRSGSYYFETKITKGIAKGGAPLDRPSPHVRIGFGRREASLDGPVGKCAYSYGIRDADGQSLFMSRPKDFFPPGESLYEGDVLGLEINLPSEQLHRKVVEGLYNPAVDLQDDFAIPAESPNILRDRMPTRAKPNTFHEYIEYQPTKELLDLASPNSGYGATDNPNLKLSSTHAVPALRSLPFSSIKVYKNGVPMGTAFTDLLAFLPPVSVLQPPQAGVQIREGLDDGFLGYYPMVSVFQRGAAEINLGPDFWFPPPGYDNNSDEVDMVGSDQPSTPKGQKLKPASERFSDAIAEDIVWDIIDEIDFAFRLDNGVAPSLVTAYGAATFQSAAGASGGIAGDKMKELEQDD